MPLNLSVRWLLMRTIFLLLLLFPALAFASGASGRCSGAESHHDLIVCAIQQQRTAESDLQAFEKQYSKHLDTHQVQLFNVAEESWLKYRNAYCAYESSGVAGGTSYPVALAECKATLTRQHLRKLQTLSHCKPKNILSCPVWLGQLPSNKSLKRTRILRAAYLRRWALRGQYA